MKKYDDIVVGSGISGMTMALLLGMNGHKVLVIEKNRQIGGSIARFYRKGIPYDTGFHFTGGFSKNGMFTEMLKVLGIEKNIEPVFLSDSKHNRFIFEPEGLTFMMPSGIKNVSAKLKEYFPGEETAIDKYFEMLRRVCSKTDTMELRKISISPDAIDEDYISLDAVLSQLTNNRILKGLLSGYGMCYGVKPSEISFGNHARICRDMYESIARVKDGGDAFIKAFRERFEELGIDVVRGKYITECADVKDNYVGRFVLNTGEEVIGTRCVFSIHPKQILELLPKKYLNKAFIDRISGFEASSGFFTLFGAVEVDDDVGADGFVPTIDSLFPDTDTNKLLDPEYKGIPAQAILRNMEVVNGKKVVVVNSFEPSFVEHVREWEGSSTGHRPADYQEYKDRHVESIKKRIESVYPEYKGVLKIMGSASVLTFRDYLNSYDGSAYGIKQLMGQYNLFGKLPLRNLYAVGQSSVLPGVVGAMMSSFILGRSIIDRSEYNNFIEERLVD